MDMLKVNIFYDFTWKSCAMQRVSSQRTARPAPITCHRVVEPSVNNKACLLSHCGQLCEEINCTRFPQLITAELSHVCEKNSSVH